MGYRFRFRSKSKYHAVKATAIDGTVCDSMRERDRYNELYLMQAAGDISEFRYQVKFELIPAQRAPSGAAYRRCCYIADFVYLDKDGNEVVEDTKGERTEVYRIKKKLMLERYGIEIKET